MKQLASSLGLALLVTGCGLVIGLESSYEGAPLGSDPTADGAAPQAPGGDASCPDGGCKECVAGDFRCVGVELEQCAGGFFKPLETCESADKCSATGGNCLGIFCTPGQRRCAQDRLERCNAGQTMFELELQCGVGLCDALQKRCNKCVPSADIGCQDSQTVERCAADGQTTSFVACLPPTPKCVSSASGVACLQCGDDSHCATTTACRAPQCVNGTCGTKTDLAQEGRIVTPAAEQSCVQTICKNGAATVAQLPAGTKCGEGQGFSYYCTAGGICLAEN